MSVQTYYSIECCEWTCFGVYIHLYSYRGFPENFSELFYEQRDKVCGSDPFPPATIEYSPKHICIHIDTSDFPTAGKDADMDKYNSILNGVPGIYSAYFTSYANDPIDLKRYYSENDYTFDYDYVHKLTYCNLYFYTYVYYPFAYSFEFGIRFDENVTEETALLVEETIKKCTFLLPYDEMVKWVEREINGRCLTMEYFNIELDHDQNVNFVQTVMLALNTIPGISSVTLNEKYDPERPG